MTITEKSSSGVILLRLGFCYRLKWYKSWGCYIGFKLHTVWPLHWRPVWEATDCFGREAAHTNPFQHRQRLPSAREWLLLGCPVDRPAKPEAFLLSSRHCRASAHSYRKLEWLTVSYHSLWQLQTPPFVQIARSHLWVHVGKKKLFLKK